MLRWNAQFLIGFRLRECGTVQNLNSKGLRKTYSGQTESARAQRNTDAAGVRSAGTLEYQRRRGPFGAYFGMNMTFMPRNISDWNLVEWLSIDWRLKPAKCLKFTGSLWDLIRGSIFFGHLYFAQVLWKTSLESESIEPSINFLAFQVQNFWLKTTNELIIWLRD